MFRHPFAFLFCLGDLVKDCGAVMRVQRECTEQGDEASEPGRSEAIEVVDRVIQ